MFANIAIALIDDGTPIFMQIYENFKRAINNGSLEAGVTLPPTRQLATKLGVSRHTILKSMKLLVTQGYVDSNDQILRVKSVDQPEPKSKSELDFSPDRVIQPSMSAESAREQLQSGELIAIQVDYDSLGRLHLDSGLQWSRIAQQQEKSRSTNSATALELCGDLALRKAVSRYLNCFRSLRCHCDDILVFSSRSAALDFVFRLTMNRGDRAIVENPSRPDVRALLSVHGISMDTVDIDKQGLNVESVSRLAQSAKLLYVAPAHNQPTGVTLDIERRRELLAWAARTRTTILEDSVDSDYWHNSRPLPSIQGLDEHDIVFHLTSFEHVIGDICGLNFVVVPSIWRESAVALMTVVNPRNSISEQQVLAEFLERGFVERYLRKNQRELAARRRLLVVALMKSFGKRISISRDSGGSKIFVRFEQSWAHETIEKSAKQSGFPLHSVNAFYADSIPQLAYCVDFGMLSSDSLIAATELFSSLLMTYAVEKLDENSREFSLSADVSQGLNVFQSLSS